MLAIQAGALLTQMAQGGVVELGPGEDTTLADLVAAGLVVPAPDTSDDERRLADARRALAELHAFRSGQVGAPDAAGLEEKRLRTLILDLAEKTSRANGAARVRVAGGAPYRTAPDSEALYVLTYHARALLSDLAPRLSRVGRLTLDEFREHMNVLRQVVAHRARRASAMLGSMVQCAPPDASDGAIRSAAVGLAARNEPEHEVVGRWSVLVKSLMEADAQDDTHSREWSVDQEVAAAEAMILVTPDLSTLGAGSAIEAHRRRIHLLSTHCGGNPEDALDATVLLVSAGGAIPEAADIATRAQWLGAPLSLTAALVARSSPSPNPAELVAQIHGQLVQAQEGQSEAERTTASVLLALAGHDPAAMVQRTRDLRAYLARFAPSGMLVQAALLALLPVDLAEALDLLRLASSELQGHRLGGGGAEALTLAVKLLMQTALLARGAEGDPEECAGFVRFDQLALANLGTAGLASQVPLSLAALTAFHRPALDAALYYQETHQPTHSPYVHSHSHSRSRGGSWG
jgi:hypothetical protein